MSDEEKMRRVVGLALSHVLNPDWAGNRAERGLRDNLIELGFLERANVDGPDGAYWEPRLTALGKSCALAEESE